MEILMTVLGGIGLFLFGMSLMTDGLKSLAGESLKQLLSRFTGGKFSAILSGMVLTAVIQSSSATILMTIGFVSAGLITFTQSLGVIIGTSIGSTSTGWIVSLVGFQISMGSLALPIIGVGVFLRLFTHGKMSSLGSVMTGFGMLFLGISVLQDGMADFSDVFDFTSFNGDRFYHLLLLALIGTVMTVIMQSSSVAVAITLTALYSGAINFDQGAALVIGQNIGTTFKAIIAAIGASHAAKRTSVAHILFNLFTGFVALALFPLLTSAVFKMSDWLDVDDLTISLALFYTLFNVLGVLMILPFMKPFEKLIARLVPEKGNPLTIYLDPSVAEVGPVAIEASRRTLMAVHKTLLEAMQELFATKRETVPFFKKKQLAAEAIQETRAFLRDVQLSVESEDKQKYERHVSVLHALDHLERLIMALSETGYLRTISSSRSLQAVTAQVQEMIENSLRSMEEGNGENNYLQKVEETSKEIAEIRRSDRKHLLKNAISEELNVDRAIAKVHALLWLDRISHHLWRILTHLQP